MQDILSMDLSELSDLMKQQGQPAYRAKQVFFWTSRGIEPEGMTNLPRSLRERLTSFSQPVAIHKKLVSALDGTVKYLFRLADGNLVEGVLMRYHYGNTLCISTQVGCRMGCAFCASTLEGCVRDLTAGEMLRFVALVEQDQPHDAEHARTVTNIVLMGSGEPLDNYDEVVRFLHLISAPEGMNISPRNISLSTCGLIDRLECFTAEAPHVTLSVSLHAPTDEIRNQIMPVNRRFGVGEVIAAARRYADTTGRRVIFEYALIKGLNASKREAELLAKNLRNVNCHVNLIPLNRVEERNLAGVTRSEAEQFRAWLEEAHISATVRREMGADINGACGQLRRGELKKQEADQGESQ